MKHDFSHAIERMVFRRDMNNSARIQQNNNNNNNIAFFPKQVGVRLEMKPERNKFKVQAH